MSEVEALTLRLTDAEPAVRRDALERLADLRDAALPALDALVLALDDEDAEVRLAAVHAIGAVDPTETEFALEWAMQSPDLRVAIAAKTLVSRTARLRGPDSTLWRAPATGYAD